MLADPATGRNRRLSWSVRAALRSRGAAGGEYLRMLDTFLALLFATFLAAGLPFVFTGDPAAFFLVAFVCFCAVLFAVVVGGCLALLFGRGGSDFDYELDEDFLAVGAGGFSRVMASASALAAAAAGRNQAVLAGRAAAALSVRLPWSHLAEKRMTVEIVEAENLIVLRDPAVESTFVWSPPSALHLFCGDPARLAEARRFLSDKLPGLLPYEKRPPAKWRLCVRIGISVFMLSGIAWFVARSL